MKSYGQPLNNEIQVATLHKSKSLELNIVFNIDLNWYDFHLEDCNNYTREYQTYVLWTSYKNVVIFLIFAKKQINNYICSKESEKNINVKGSCVYNTREYRYTKFQMIFMLLAPTIVSALLVFISIKITSRLIVDIKRYEMISYLIILVLTYILGGINDISQALSTLGKKSKYVREYINSQGKFYIDVA